MKKFAFGILLVFFFFAPKEAFSLAYDKKKGTTLIGTEKGTTEDEGFFLTGLGNLPVCKILNVDKYTILRQGLKTNYDSNGKLHSVEKGLFDCNLSIYDKPLTSLYEGMIEFLQEKQIHVHYKHSNGKAYVYEKKSDNIWYYKEFDERYLWDNPKSGLITRTATANEIQHAERLVVFYNNIDLSSPSAKIYDGIINKDIYINNKVSSEKKFSQPTSQKEISKNKNTKLDESQFSKKCEGGIFSKGHKRGTQEFEDCVKMETGLAIVADFEKQQKKEERNMKTTLKQDQKQRTVNDQQVSNSDNNREEQIKISKMKPEDRHAYTCAEKFSFRKGSDKFKDCIFELYKAEAELEKLELQKQVAKANADAARANAEAARAGAERQERLALAQTEAAKMQALAARQQAIAANTADSLALIESGLRMMSPQRPAPRMQTTCTYTGSFMNCF